MTAKTEDLYNKFEKWLEASFISGINPIERGRLLSAFIMGYTISLLEDAENKN
jgi:hypothetical protein